MAETTKQLVATLAADNAELKKELGRLAESHNTVVSAMNRMATTLANLGNDIATGLNQQSIGIRALIATTSEVLAKQGVITMADWQDIMLFNYERATADTRKELEAATMREEGEISQEELPNDSPIITQ